MNFTESELRAIDRALSIAAGVYEEDAGNRAMLPTVSAELTRDAAQARKLAERLNKFLNRK